MPSQQERKKDRSTAHQALVVFCTCPDADLAERLAGQLVEKNLAACVNILPQIRSIYRWNDSLANDEETLMVIKASRRSYRSLQAWLIEHHPYEVPEVIALPVTDGSPSYLEWIMRETTASRT